MSQMVERVARALVAVRFGSDGLMMFDPVPDGFPNSSEARLLFSKRVDEARKDARAAIEALMDPSKEMVDAGSDEMTNGKQTWQSMIQAALKESA